MGGADTIFLGRARRDRGRPRRRAARLPRAGRSIVSTAHLHRIDGTPRADFLAELVAAQPSIVVGGAHGKTTTAAMIAFVLHETGRDPAWIIGGVVPQLGGNAGTGAGWLVVEGDESDRSIGALRPQIAVLTNIELDHHATYASEAELQGLLRRVARRTFRTSSAAGSSAPVELELGVPGEHNRQNAAAALAALELAGVPRAEAEAAIVRFTGVDRRLELVGERGGVSVYDDYGHNPTELEATLRTARELTDGRLIAVYQPHVVERTRQLHRELGAALGLADAAIVTDIIDARDAPRAGRHREARRRRAASRGARRVGAVARGRGRRSHSRGRDRATSCSRSAWGSRGRSRARSSRGCPA